MTRKPLPPDWHRDTAAEADSARWESEASIQSVMDRLNLSQATSPRSLPDTQRAASGATLPLTDTAYATAPRAIASLLSHHPALRTAMTHDPRLLAFIQGWQACLETENRAAADSLAAALLRWHQHEIAPTTQESTTS